MTINRLNQGTTNQVLVKAISGQTTNLLELQDSSGNVVSSIGPTGAVGVPSAVTSGQILTAQGSGTAAWQTPTSDAGLVHINTSTFSAVASHSVNDVFSADFSRYYIFVNAVASGAAGLLMRMRVGGSDFSSAVYMNQNVHFFGTSAPSVSRNVSATSWSANNSLSTTNTHFQKMMITNPFQTKTIAGFREIAVAFDTVNIINEINAFGLNNTASYTGFSFISSSVETITGDVSVYGVKE